MQFLITGKMQEKLNIYMKNFKNFKISERITLMILLIIGLVFISGCIDREVKILNVTTCSNVIIPSDGAFPVPDLNTSSNSFYEGSLIYVCANVTTSAGGNSLEIKILNFSEHILNLSDAPVVAESEKYAESIERWHCVNFSDKLPEGKYMVEVKLGEKEKHMLIEVKKQVNNESSLKEAMRKVVEGNNKFAFELYKKFSTNDDNIFFSPYSISTALAMTYEGARGKTAEEIENVFHFPKDSETRRNGFLKIIEEINKQNETNKFYEFHTANALWAQKEYKFLKEYFDAVEKYYEGKVTNVDFVGDTENSRITINRWVENQTNNKIKDLIPKGYINELTRLVITNAIYFKGKWAKQFNESDTKDEDFRISKDRIVKVPMMQRTDEEAKFNYTEDDKVQILEMPYSGGKISMLILLPKDENLKNLENMLTVEQLSEWKKNLKEQKVKIFIPKFKFETKYFMKETLKEMGMPTPFSENADLSGMTEEKGLLISEVIHQAFVEVNEEGTEAAAATAVIIGTTAIPNENIIFKADHPFIFIIQEKETGNILFIGRVVNPK